jgi:hypothetical protein
MGNRSRLFTGLAALALVAVACGGNDEGADSTTTSVPAATTSTTPSTTTTSSTTTTTVEPTSTTLSIEDQVRAGVARYDENYVACLRAPTECDPADVVLDGSTAWQYMSGTVADMVANEYFVGPEDWGRTVIESIEPKPDFTLVTMCTYTTMVLYGPPAPDGSPTLVNNNAGTVRQAKEMVQDPADLIWKVRQSTTLLSETGADQCPAL